MTVSIEMFATELRAGYNDGSWGAVVARYLADTVVIYHHPEEEQDGVKDGAMVAEALTHDQTDKLAYLLTDFARTAESVGVDGNKVVADIVVTGNLSDGKQIKAPMRAVFTVADGRIVQIDNHAESPGAVELRNAAIASLQTTPKAVSQAGLASAEE